MRWTSLSKTHAASVDTAVHPFDEQESVVGRDSPPVIAQSTVREVVSLGVDRLLLQKNGKRFGCLDGIGMEVSHAWDGCPPVIGGSDSPSLATVKQ